MKIALPRANCVPISAFKDLLTSAAVMEQIRIQLQVCVNDAEQFDDDYPEGKNNE